MTSIGRFGEASASAARSCSPFDSARSQGVPGCWCYPELACSDADVERSLVEYDFVFTGVWVLLGRDMLVADADRGRYRAPYRAFLLRDIAISLNSAGYQA